MQMDIVRNAGITSILIEASVSRMLKDALFRRILKNAKSVKMDMKWIEENVNQKSLNCLGILFKWTSISLMEKLMKKSKKLR